MNNIIYLLMMMSLCGSLCAFRGESQRSNTKFLLSSHRFVEEVYMGFDLKTKKQIYDDMVETRDYYRDLAIEEINKAEKMVENHLEEGIKGLYHTAFDVMLSALWNNACVLTVAGEIGKGENKTFANVIINYFDFRNQLRKIDERIDMYNWCQEALDYMEYS